MLSHLAQTDLILSCGLIILRPRLSALLALLDNNGVSLGSCLHFHLNAICCCCKTVQPRLAPNSLSGRGWTFRPPIYLPHFLRARITCVASAPLIDPRGTHSGMSAWCVSILPAELHSPVFWTCSSISFCHWKWFLKLHWRVKKNWSSWGCLLQGQEDFFRLLPKEWLHPPFLRAGYWHSILPFFLIKGLNI